MLTAREHKMKCHVLQVKNFIATTHFLDSFGNHSEFGAAFYNDNSDTHIKMTPDVMSYKLDVYSQPFVGGGSDWAT